MTTTSAAIYNTSPYQWNVFTAASWTMDATTNEDVKLTSAGGDTGGTDASWAINNITLPGSAQTVYVWLNTYTNTDCSTGPYDDGVVAFAVFTSGIGVSSTLTESLTATISDYAIGFGNLDSGNVRYATADETGNTVEPASDLPTYIEVSTNAGNGMSIAIKDIGDGSANAGLYDSTIPNLIPAVASSAVSAGSEEYGVYGKDADANITIDEGFDDDTTSDLAITRAMQTFATSSGGLSAENVDISAKASVAGATEAGSYDDTLILAVTPTY